MFCGLVRKEDLGVECGRLEGLAAFQCFFEAHESRAYGSERKKVEGKTCEDMLQSLICRGGLDHVPGRYNPDRQERPNLQVVLRIWDSVFSCHVGRIFDGFRGSRSSSTVQCHNRNTATYDCANCGSATAPPSRRSGRPQAFPGMVFFVRLTQAF